MKTITVLAVLGSLALAACGGSSNSSNASSSGTTTSAAATSSSSNANSAPGYGGGSTATTKTTAASNTSSGSTVKEAMLDYRFGTKTITGKPGAKVKVVLTNRGKTEHNFKIPSQKGVDADVEPGKTATVTLTVPKSGSVQFFCEYHKGLGMVGTVKAS